MVAVIGPEVKASRHAPPESPSAAQLLRCRLPELPAPSNRVGCQLLTWCDDETHLNSTWNADWIYGDWSAGRVEGY